MSDGPNDNVYMRQYMVQVDGFNIDRPNAFFRITGEHNVLALEAALAEFTRLINKAAVDDRISEVILFLITEDKFSRTSQKIAFWPEELTNFGPYKPEAYPMPDILD